MFTIPGNTISYLDNMHYQTIITQAKKQMLAKELLKSMTREGVSIQLHIPKIYNATETTITRP
jgi:hypothetical protein